MSANSDLDRLVHDAEVEWLERWGAGPTEPAPSVPGVGEAAPDATLLDDTGTMRSLSDLWCDSTVLLMFWRHFGCGCGVMRAERLREEMPDYLANGIRPVIIGQGEPERAAAYKVEHGLDCTVLCDPDHEVYRAYGIGHWGFQQIMLTEPPPEYLADPVGWGAAIQVQRREQGRPIVDDPWRGIAEFVIGADGVIRLSHQYEHCYDPPDPAVILGAV